MAQLCDKLVQSAGSTFKGSSHYRALRSISIKHHPTEITEPYLKVGA
jgi:hypothetical protein